MDIHYSTLARLRFCRSSSADNWHRVDEPGLSLVVPHVVPCVGVLMGLAADDPESQARLAAFAQGLQQSGWSIGQNLWIDYRWGGGDPENMRKYAADLVALAPDVILAHSSACRRQLC